MDKAFLEVFPGIKADAELRNIFPHMTVRQLKYSGDKTSLLIYAVLKRLIGRQQLEEIEKLIEAQYLTALSMHAHIIERYELPSAYTLKELSEAYRSSLLYELSKDQPLDSRFLEKAVFQTDGEDSLLLDLEDHPYARERENAWREQISRIFAERFSYAVKLSFRYEARRNKAFLTAPDKVIIEKPGESAASHGDAEAEPAAGPILEAASGKESAETVAGKKKSSAAGSGRKSGTLNRGKGRKGSVRSPKPFYSEEDPDRIYGRAFQDEVRTIASYGNTEGTMVIEGEIFTFESRPMKNTERSILSFSLTDYTDSISVKLFVASEDVKAFSDRLTVGTAIRLKGLAQYDSFDKEISIRSVVGITRVERDFKEKRVDTAPVKRVELHCHTKASENDGIADVSDLIRTAKGWGQPALAVTDHGCVYAFPDAFHSVKPKDDFKIIYGMEGYLVDDTKESVKNPCSRGMLDSCVVFDIETTGFSPLKNHVIEIGAVRIVNGAVQDRFSAFVNPGIPIPFRIESLTGISDEMVRNAKTIDQVLPAFMEFVGDDYLAAHNAEFDISFIKENLKKLGMHVPEFTVVDMVGAARALLPKLSNYRLETVAKELQVSLEHHHRAVDDAECTARIYMKLMDRFLKRGIRTLSEMQEACRADAEAVKKMASHHVVILAANETGRVNLYHLVSESSLHYFRRRPRIPKTLLNRYREGLIIGSACSMGELYEAILNGASEDELRRIVNFYDYLEIQPTANNEYLLNSEYEIRSVKDIEEINRKIVALGEQYHKPVCATGDVHFLNPEDSILRTILQIGCGYKENDSAPPLYLRTTDEMLREFEYLGAEKAYEVVVTNTNLIADRIEKIAPVRPDKCPPVIENADEDLKNICYTKAHELYGDPLPELVKSRLDRELTAIISNGYAVMYIIAQKLVNKSVSDGYLVGSRGSVGSSFAATMAGITEVNPLKPHYRCGSCRYSDFDSEFVRPYENVTGCDMPDRVCPVCGAPLIKDGYNIPFETFLGFKGNKEPDIDLNFSGEYQAKAHAYTEVIFGQGQTFKAGTIGTVAEKTAIGYVLHYLEDNGIEKRKCEVTRIAHGLEGVRRTSGQHPGGIIVLPYGEDINSFTPVQHPANDQNSPIITTHFDYHSIDQNLLKLDILGHDDPTMIRMLQDLTGIDPRSFPLDSKEVMSLFQNTSALGVTPEDIRGCPLGALGLPEFGTDNAISMLLEAKPKYVSDLIRISGLAHGTNVWHGNAQKLIEEGKCDIATAVCTRDDIMTYLIEKGLENEKAFKIMEAVRKGQVAKGRCADWAAWKQEMIEHGVPDWYIWSCEHIEYMFPKAHAAAYVMMALRIAYCKVFHPLPYYCAYFTIRANGFDYELCCQGREKLERNIDEFEARKDELSAREEDMLRDMRICQEMYARGYSFRPIDIYEASASRFRIVSERELMPSFMSIAGMGGVAAETLEAAAHQSPFTSLADMRQRGKVSQTILDKMAEMKLLSGIPETDQFSLFDRL